MKLLRLFIITTLLMALPAQAVRTNELVGSFKIAADLARRSSQELAVKQAAAIITTVIASTPDTDGDPFPEPPAYLSGSGPTGGGLIPTGLGAPINDGYGAKLGYCAWDNGSVMSGGNRLNGSATNTGAVTFAVVSAGLDGVFNRTCAQIASGAATTDDDFVVSVSTAQIRQGVGGTVYFADPVADMTALGLLNSASQTVGAMGRQHLAIRRQHLCGQQCHDHWWHDQQHHDWQHDTVIGCFHDTDWFAHWQCHRQPHWQRHWQSGRQCNGKRHR
jgi:hypothetical protein